MCFYKNECEAISRIWILPMKRRMIIRITLMNECKASTSVLKSITKVNNINK